ncbi:GL18095 [Drosophila persimilis]|uniref:GL18095 n=1 Tax=Drosophila persimilis TaxID=7234 RepID=B4HC32_DROPE|nr:GL18095 [Drosophila persimilis]
MTGEGLGTAGTAGSGLGAEDAFRQNPLELVDIGPQALDTGGSSNLERVNDECCPRNVDGLGWWLGCA